MVAAGVSDADRRQFRPPDRRSGGRPDPRHQRSARPREPGREPVQARARTSRWPPGRSAATRRRPPTCSCARRFSATRDRAACLRASPSTAAPSARTATPTSASTAMPLETKADRVRRRPRLPPGAGRRLAAGARSLRALRKSRAAPLSSSGYRNANPPARAFSGSTRWPVTSSPAISPSARRSANAGTGSSAGRRSTRPSVRANSRVGHRVRRRDVERARDAGRRQRPAHHRHPVVAVNPREVLAAGSERTADEEAERQRHQRQRAAVRCRARCRCAAGRRASAAPRRAPPSPIRGRARRESPSRAALSSVSGSSPRAP